MTLAVHRCPTITIAFVHVLDHALAFVTARKIRSSPAIHSSQKEIRSKSRSIAIGSNAVSPGN